MYVGLPSIFYDNETRRRSLYGKAGAFRLTPYGLEYRTLSSAMYANDTLIKIVWNGIIQVIHAFNANVPLPSGSIIQKAINESDLYLANELIRKYGISIKEYEPTVVKSAKSIFDF